MLNTMGDLDSAVSEYIDIDSKLPYITISASGEAQIDHRLRHILKCTCAGHSKLAMDPCTSGIL